MLPHSVTHVPHTGKDYTANHRLASADLERVEGVSQVAAADGADSLETWPGATDDIVIVERRRAVVAAADDASSESAAAVCSTAHAGADGRTGSGKEDSP